MRGVPVRESEVEIGGKPLRELGYEWTDLGSLLMKQHAPDSNMDR